jgi:chromosome segregation ATPase
MAATTRPTQAAALAAIADKLDRLFSTLTTLEQRMAVHDEKHLRLDREHDGFDQMMRRHAEAIAAHDRQIASLDNDIKSLTGKMSKLTDNLNRVIWIVVTPILAAAVMAIIALIGQVTP